MQLSSDDVAQIAQEVWSSMLGLDIDRVSDDAEFSGNAVAGSVGVTGATDCLISVEMGFEGARAFAAAMFGLAADEVSTEDITDAAGELTNMVGGNIKTLLPEPSTLSLPVVAQGTIPPTLKVVGGKVILDVRFTSTGHPIHVTVWSRPNSN